ncbi:MAG: Internalin-A precursor [Firmicutes bacterium ADurb.Bin419]|nr:MAG: Internalin-A precursor [Firmicutes bacterium ADurb.Bin419]
MKNHLFRILAYLIVLTFLLQPIQTLAYADQVEISDNSSMAAAQTPAPSEPYPEQFEKEYEMEIEAERQRILEEHLREEGMPVELLSHEYGSNPQERPEYVPPSEEVIAQTKAQVDSFSCASVTDVPQIECEALVALYESTNGAGWNHNDNWLITNTVDTWWGIYAIFGYVQGISLSENNLNGSIPAELGNLSDLETLFLDDNQLIGSIPPELGNLSNLETLYLNYNVLSGSIPAELGNLSDLGFLSLEVNQLSGSIPAELGNLSDLQELYLTSNQLSGSIPPELGNLSKLVTLRLHYNRLSGSIPAELGNLSNLVRLYLNVNKLSGSIPAELGNLSELVTLCLDINQLSGSIPLSFINLTSLVTFFFRNTLLCEPTTPEFLAWKATVVRWEGTGIVCDGLPIITNIEINQALGIQKDNEQNFVANKPTVIRLQLDQKVPVDRHTQKLEVVRDGSSIQTLYPNYNSSQSKILEFYCPMVSTVCGNWPPGEYTFKAYVGSNSLTKTADFVTTKTLRILVHPVKVVDGLNIIKLTNDEWKTSYRFLKNTYPISSNSIEWVIGSELTMLGKDITIFTSRLNFLSSWSFGYDRVLAIIPPIADCTENGCYLGGSSSKASACLANGSFYNEFDDTWWNIDYLEQCVTHEIGHTLGLGDEYDNSEATYFCNVNPPPSDYYDCGGVDQPSAWNGDGTGSLIPASAHPYEVNGRGLLPNSLSFMGNGEPQNSYWISQDIYSHIFNKLTTSPSSQSAQPMEVKRVALANGWISREESVSFDPWYSFESTFTQSTVGDYSIEAVSADESVLATQNFDISFTDFSNPPIFHERAPFSLLVPFPIGTIRFDIRHSGIKIGSLEVNPGIPSVNITSPSSGDSWSTGSEQTIRWDGIADGSIYYTVFYTADGVNFQILGSDLIGNSLVVNTEFLPGSQTSQIKILATDGINTTEDFSDGFFQVEGKSPLAKVYNPLNNEQIPYGISALLDGTGYDLEDGIISGDNISWSSDKDGFLGTGPNILVDLSYGCHTLTIKITDSDGYSSQDSINIFVGSKIFIPLILR